MQKIKVKKGAQLADYQAYGSLTNAVREFLQTTQQTAAQLQDCTIWMINSTATGGGVAEMLPSQMRLMRELNVEIEWLVIEATDEDFFTLTKRIHNAIHGSGVGKFSARDQEVYEEVNAQNLEKALGFIKDGDLVVIHDPQPMPLARMIKAHRKVKTIWRCHIGLEEQNETTSGVWKFLSDYFDDYDHFVFSLDSYVPQEIAHKTTLITPAIDPLSHKNRALQMHKLIGILHQSGIINDRDPILFDFYKHQVRRVLPDGGFGAVNENSRLDLIFRPAILEISRWDRLKGFKELMEAFCLMKKQNAKKADKKSTAYKRIKKCRLILGGPDPKFVSDDPEGKAVLEELIKQYKGFDPALQEDIAILLLPLDNPKENALIVNALQRSSSIVVQNSLQEGFGLTATEGMWKQKPMLVSGAAGLVHQVQDKINGRINNDPQDIESLAVVLEEMLNKPKDRDKWGFNGQLRVIERFTLFTQIAQWMALLTQIRKS